MNSAPDPRNLLASLSAEAQERVRAAEAAIVELAATYLPEALFASAFFRLVAHPAGSERQAGSDTSTAALERLVFLLWRANPEGHALPTADVVRDMVARTKDLAHDAVFATATATRANDLDGLLGRVLINAQVVRGSA